MDDVAGAAEVLHIAGVKWLQAWTSFIGAAHSQRSQARRLGWLWYVIGCAPRIVRALRASVHGHMGMPHGSRGGVAEYGKSDVAHGGCTTRRCPSHPSSIAPVYTVYARFIFAPCAFLAPRAFNETTL